jgi:predicted metal-dependent phosphoesterase TrpH
MFADLHLHTRFSDGSFTPEQVVEHATKQRLSTLALTDHDTLEGCAPMAAACATAGIEFIPGIELTVEHANQEIHLLGYFLNLEDENLRREIALFQSVRQDRIREMVLRLNRLGVPLRAEDVFALADCRSPGRPHVARALAELGHCRTMDEAFERFLKRHRPAWVPKHKLSAASAIELVHRAGGLAVMAHPGLNRTDSSIPDLAAAGMDGLECFHSRHSTAQMQHYLAIAGELSLLITGGSDCHGDGRGKPLIGTIKLPYEYVRQLKRRVAERRSAAPPPPADALTSA